MTRALLAVLMLASLVVGQNYNVTPVDTTTYDKTITNLSVDSIAHTKAFYNGRYEDMAVVVLVDDTTSAGFSGDSVQFILAYQLGYLTVDSAYDLDTTWQLDTVMIDTVSSDNFGAGFMGSIDSTGALNKSMDAVDTTNVDGWACYSKWFLPEWSPYIRYVVKGIADNTASNLKLVVQHTQRTYTNTR